MDPQSGRCVPGTSRVQGVGSNDDESVGGGSSARKREMLTCFQTPFELHTYKDRAFTQQISGNPLNKI